jgi:hypothetical protein
LADLLGVRAAQNLSAESESARRKQASETAHSYLRLLPELRARVDGPHIQGEPPVSAARHAVLRGFEETDILPFGGVLPPLKVQLGAEVLMTFVPPFPVYPPETSWMREARTEIPGLIIRTTPGGSRVVFLPADLDRRFARDNLPDHGNLLANLVRWAAKEHVPISVQGPGLIDCHLYHQPGRAILHLVNLTSAGTWRQPVDELIPVGPLRLRMKLPEDVRGRHLRFLVSGRTQSASVTSGWSRFEIERLVDHEVAVLT